MDSVAKWGFRLKLAIIILICTFILSLLLVPSSGEELTGTTDALFTFILIIFLLMLPLIPILILLDARAIKKSKDYNWEPRLWFWGIGVLFYGIMVPPYLLFRKKKVGKVGKPLNNTIFVNFLINSSLQNQIGFAPNKDIHESVINKYIVKLKLTFIIFIVCFLGMEWTEQSKNTSLVLTILFFISVLALVVLVWQDGKIINQYGNWKPRYLLWMLLTAVFYGFPVVLYLVRRYQKQGDIGPPLVEISPLNTLFSKGRGKQEPAQSEDQSTNQKLEFDDGPHRDKIEQAKLALEQGNRLAREEEYIDARDAFERARTTWKELEENDGFGESPVRRGRQNVAVQAERGIENCWIEPLADRVETAETHLDNDEYGKARDLFEQINAVLENRSFKHTDTKSLEQRVQDGQTRLDSRSSSARSTPSTEEDYESEIGDAVPDESTESDETGAIRRAVIAFLSVGALGGGGLYLSRQQLTSQDEASQDETNQDETNQDETNQDETSQDETSPQTPGSFLWSYETGDSVQSAPTVVDGTVHVGSDDGTVYALSADDGTEQWSFQTGFEVHSSPTVIDGTVYVGSLDNSVYALSADDGTEQWSFQTGEQVWASPAVVDGTVYVGSLDNSVYALSADDGTEQWSFQTGRGIHSSPSVVNGTVYVGSLDNSVYALSADDGTEQWSFQTGRGIHSSPSVINGTVHVGSDDGNMYALSADDGTKQWSYELESRVTSSPVVVDGITYFGHYKSVYALSAQEGTEQWSYRIGDTVESSLTVVDGTVYVGCFEDIVYALSADDGTEQWSFQTGDGVGASPAVVNGTVYVGSYDSNVYALSE